jgi:hypothetical protein
VSNNFCVRAVCFQTCPLKRVNVPITWISLQRVHSSVGIALRYGLDDRGSRARFPAGAGVSRTALGPTQPPIQWVPGALSLGVKRPGCEADHSPPSSAEVKE